MRHILMVLIALAFLALPVYAIDWDIEGIVTLASNDGVAHGCPVDSNLILTSRHVSASSTMMGATRRGFFIWEAAGVIGSAVGVDYDFRRDLALIKTDVPVPHVYPIADAAPRIGSRVAIAAFDERLGRKLVVTKVINIVAMHIVTADPGMPGMSGSCVLNEKQEVVGVFQWGIKLGADAKPHGVASGIWDGWDVVGWLPDAILGEEPAQQEVPEVLEVPEAEAP